MASVEKFSKSSIVNQLRHIERTIQNPSNPDIDREKSNQNYSLVHRNISSYDYYKERLSQCYLYNREDVKTTFGWIVTCPEDLPEDQTDLFFYNVHDFLNERYGEENCIQSVVHKDESGRPHIHWIGIPVVKDKKHSQGIKVCCNDVINRKDLRNFHDDLDRYLKNNGLNCSVKTGITKAQGGNRTVAEMKKEREMQRTRQAERRW
jgi:plasmid recombination enzyme